MDIVDVAKKEVGVIGLDFNLTEVLHKLVDDSFLSVVDEEGYFQGIITRNRSSKPSIRSCIIFQMNTRWFQNEKIIASFIDQKELSENSQSAWFLIWTNLLSRSMEKVTPTNLRIYQASIKDFKPAVQNENYPLLTNFYIICIKNALFLNTIVWSCLKFNRPRPMIGNCWSDPFWEESTNPQGRLMALLILEMGVAKWDPPSQDRRYSAGLSRHSSGQRWPKRVLKVPEPLLDDLQLFLDGIYLFDNKGKCYSRQWGFDN